MLALQMRLEVRSSTVICKRLFTELTDRLRFSIRRRLRLVEKRPNRRAKTSRHERPKSLRSTTNSAKLPEERVPTNAFAQLGRSFKIERLDKMSTDNAYPTTARNRPSRSTGHMHGQRWQAARVTLGTSCVMIMRALAWAPGSRSCHSLTQRPHVQRTLVTLHPDCA